MKKHNIVFFGTSNKSELILEKLKENFNLTLCITKRDAKVGRKQTSIPNGVKRWAINNDVEFLEIQSIKKEITTILNVINSHKPVVGIVADFSFIIPNQIINSFEKGIINIHFSLLPKYRGASPVQHSILNGDNITGITYMLIDEGMDTGDILYQSEYKLHNTETTQSLYKDLFTQAANELPTVINDYLNDIIIPTPQNHKDATYCYSEFDSSKTFIFKQDAKIKWNKGINFVDKQIRAYFTWPIAWSTFEDMLNNDIYINLITLNLCVQNENNSYSDCKKIALKNSKNGPLVVKFYEAKKIYDNSTEFLQPIKVQVEGKTVINWKDFVNGYLKF